MGFISEHIGTEQGFCPCSVLLRAISALACAFVLSLICVGGASAAGEPQLSLDVDSPHAYAPGEAIELSADAGDAQDCEFKFVWMKDGWAKWGVVRDLAAEPTCSWMPEEAGEYTLYLDVLHPDGTVATVTCALSLTEEYAFRGVQCSTGGVAVAGIPVTVSALTSGNTASLRYKFVWQKDGWAKWGVIRDFSPEGQVTWTPDAGAGAYAVYADVVDSTGAVATRYAALEVGAVALESPAGTKLEYAPGLEIPLHALAADGAFAQFKFVWQKDGWAKWGVARDCAASADAVWRPEEAGSYTLYLDALDEAGAVTTVTLGVELTEEWRFGGIAASEPSPQPCIKGAGTDLTAQTSGTTAGLEYKFVWMKDGWAKWGVVRDFASDPTCHWEFPGTGDFTLYVDVKDSTGSVVTYTAPYTVTRAWAIDRVELSAQNQAVGESVTITAEVNGEFDNLRYKFVWQRNGSWADGQWGVLQKASARNTAVFTPTEPGLYTIYVDVIEPDDESATKTATYSAWKLVGAKAQVRGSSQSATGFTVVLSPDFGGAEMPEGFTYKYVWRKGNDWAQWGVIEERTDAASITWAPTAGTGSYTFYIDVFAPDAVADEHETVYVSATILDIVQDIRPSLAHGTKTAQYQKYIVLHDTEGNGGPSTVIGGWIYDGNYVAAHFIIGKDGAIWQCVPMDQIAHHAGFGNTGHNAFYGVTDESRDDKRGTTPIGSWARDYGMNSYSIGIELVHVGGSGYYPEAQLKALDDLISYIDDYYGFESTIIDHKMWRSGNSDTSPEFARYLANYRDHRTHD